MRYAPCAVRFKMSATRIFYNRRRRRHITKIVAQRHLSKAHTARRTAHGFLINGRKVANLFATSLYTPYVSKFVAQNRLPRRRDFIGTANGRIMRSGVEELRIFAAFRKDFDKNIGCGIQGFLIFRFRRLGH